MLNYSLVKKTFADKLSNDAEGLARFESAFYHTMKFVYEQGVKDGEQARDAEAVGIIK